MEKQEIKAYFDRCAPSWDAEMIRNEDAIRAILDNAGICPGFSVLDVACGTGVLFPDYYSRGVTDLTGIDISSEMAKRAREKFPQATVICGDVETYSFDRQFDAVMVYNAFPHFPDPKALIAALAGLTKTGGRLSVAHGMSRAMIEAHHAGAARQVSVELMGERELAALFAPWFDVDVMVSNDMMYQVAGTRNAEKR